MTGGLLAVGSSCSGEPLHRARLWAMDTTRRLHVVDLDAAPTPDLKWALEKLPVPGDAMPIACDAHRRVMVLDNGAVWRLDVTGRLWRPMNSESEMKSNKEGPALVAAGNWCRGRWVADRERRLFVLEQGRRRSVIAGDAPVPGTARIMAVDVTALTVLLEDGSRLMWAGRWVPAPGVLDTSGVMRVSVTSSFCMKAGVDVYAGDVLALPEAEARALLRAGRAEPAPVEVAG